jgi:hypothetical protein
MLIPIGREEFHQLIPLVATGDQYRYCWGSPRDFLPRLLISFLAAVISLVVGNYSSAGDIALLVGVPGGMYWLWGPILTAGQRNARLRRYKFAAFAQGEVEDLYLSEQVRGKEETVNERGDFMVVENRQTILSLEIGDAEGYLTTLRVPFRKEDKRIRRGDRIALLVFSNDGRFDRIDDCSDAYLPQLKYWLSDYPYLRRDLFIQVGRSLARRPTAD